MITLEIILVLLAASAALEMLARKIHVPRPTLLVAGGALLALIPSAHELSRHRFVGHCALTSTASRATAKCSTIASSARNTADCGAR